MSAFQIPTKFLPDYFVLCRRTSQATITTTALASKRRPGQGFSDSNDKVQSPSSSLPSPSLTADFCLQELRAQVNAMKKAGIPSRDLDTNKRLELADYARTICATTAAATRKNIPGESLVAEQLPGTTWRLVFSTQSATLGDLPRDATVLIDFKSASTLDYTLQFKQTLGLKRLTAQSSYSVDSNGIVTFVYDKIVADVLGFSNVGVGMFGLLKGRANFIETAYFDGAYWIERGLDPSGETDFINVYVRE